MAKQLSTEKMEKILAWECSGKNKSAWCKENGINTRTFGNWIRAYRQEQTTEPAAPTGWMTVAAGGPLRQEPVIDIIIGKYTIRVDNGAERSTFRMICEELTRIC